MKKGLLVLIACMFVTAFVIRLNETTTTVVAIESQDLYTQPAKLPRDMMPRDEAYSGEYVCLPHMDTKGPQTLECAFGLKLGDNTYIALDVGNLLNADQTMKFKTNSRIRVIGRFVPIEQISSDGWQKYPISGILQVHAAEKI